ncbi:uncharacterized protein LOC122249236 [Penaeus japonicus]|uniref:uncharacterized protein LOC122249236 n=1 Tax=Penaeus japonicus TaxID=27405 RepID=UPI001C715933|nr:uncharacterized protein LOC122249236 [Penaeus japonicus]
MSRPSVISTCIVLLAFGSLATAFNPLGILQSKLSSLYELRDQLTNNAGSRENSGSFLASQGREGGRGSSYRYDSPSSSSSTPEVKYFSTSTTENSVLNSLFELGLSDIEEPVEEKKKKEEESPLNEILQEIKHLPFLPLVDVNDTLPSGVNDVGDGNPLLGYLDTIRGDAWAQFKSLAVSYTNWLEDEYKIQDLTDQLPLDLIKKVLDLGDRVNFLHVVGKRVDPGLAKYIADQLQPVFSRFESLGAGRVLNGRVSSLVGGIVRDAAWKTMHQFVGHVLKVAERVVSREDIEAFQEDLAKNSPIVAKGLQFIMSDQPIMASEATGRSMSNRGYRDYDDGYGYDGHISGYSSGGYGGGGGGGGGGYGGYGAYDDSYGSSMHGGYGYGVYLDPYLILGGIGAAALLAFLAYRLIVTTMRRRRRSDDLTLMDLSDMPNIVYSFYNMLETAENKYGSEEDNPPQLDDSDDLAEGLNSLWREYESEGGCVRCSLFDFVQNHFFTGLNVADNLAV